MYTQNYPCYPYFQDTRTPEKYLIVYTPNPNFCITAKSLGMNSPVVLFHITGVGNQRQQWILDETNLLIRNAANPNLVLGYQGQPTTGTPIILSSYMPGSAIQQWDWTTTFGTIRVMASNNMVIDNCYQKQVYNNTIWLFPYNQTAAQQWNLVSLSISQSGAPMIP